MKKTLLWLIILLLSISMIATFSLAGCKEEAAPAEEEVEKEAAEAVEEEAAEEEAAEAEEVKEPVELRILHCVPEYEGEEGVAGLSELYRLFEEKYPWITINTEAVPTADYPQAKMASVQAGAKGSDVILEWIGKDLGLLVEEGTYLDLSNYPDIIDDFDPVFLKTFSGYNDGIYATLMSNNVTGALYINLDMLEENGISIPGNIEEFYEACDQFVSKGIAPLVVGGKDQWPYVYYLGALDAVLVQDKTPGYWDRAESGFKPFIEEGGFREIAEEIKYMADKGYIDKASSTYGLQDSLNALLTGKNPFFLMDTTPISYIKEQDKFEFDVIPAPFYTAEQGLVMCIGPNAGWVINAKSEKIEEAVLFISFFQDNFDVFNKIAAGLPAQKGASLEALEAVSPLIAKLYEYVEEAISKDKSYVSAHVKWPSADVNWESFRVLSAIAAGEIDMEEGLVQLEEVYEKNLPEIYGKD